MQLRAVLWCLAVIGCETRDRAAAPPRATDGLARPLVSADAAPPDQAGADAAPPVSIPAAPELPCPPPAPGLLADLKQRVGKGVAAIGRTGGPVEVNAICEEHDGWLMSAAFPPTGTDAYMLAADFGDLRDGVAYTVWLVPRRGDARWLWHWAPGPIYDFDGDGTPEASTILDGTELEIWFAGGQDPSFSIPRLTREPNPDDRWALWEHQVVRLALDDQDQVHAFGFQAGRSRHEVPQAACALAAGLGRACGGKPIAKPAPDSNVYDDLQQQGAAVLARRASASTCVQLDEAAKARHAAVIEQAVLRRQRDGGVVAPLELSWGCSSHGETPVTVAADRGRDATTDELWSIRGDKATFVRSVSSSAPDEWTSTYDIRLGGHGDFDGDGIEESIIAETVSHPGLHARFTVRVGGQIQELPSNLVLRAADGKRDGIVRLRPFVSPVTAGPPCVPVSPDSCLPGPPPVGWWPQQGGSWDWEHEPPQVLVWRGTRFAPLARAELSAILSETAAARAPL